MNFMAPTLADPLVDLWGDNRDFADRPIMPDQDQYGPEKPDAQRYWGNVGPHWKAITDFMTTATGGDKVVRGNIDVSPETLEYMSGVVLGAAGTFLDRNISLVEKASGMIAGDPDAEIERNDIPLVRKLVGSKPGWYDKAAFYARLNHVEQEVSNAKKYIEREDVDGLRGFVTKERDVLTAEAGAKEARKAMKAVRKDRSTLELAHDLGKIDDDRYRDGIRVVKEREGVIITAFNRYYLKTVEDPVTP
jgi:hypothetical protein